MTPARPLTPGFSPVVLVAGIFEPHQWLLSPRRRKPLKRFSSGVVGFSGLKPGANDRRDASPTPGLAGNFGLPLRNFLIESEP